MRLSHFSSVGIAPFIGRASQEERGREFAMKPVGLWVSCDDHEMNWHDWCTSENFRIEQLVRSIKVKLREDANVMLITTPEQLVAFTAKYGYVPDFYHNINIPPPAPYMQTYIDWKHVAEDYQGIIIAPYQWACRMDIFWYYTWDCASGCIWDPAAIEHVRFDTTAADVIVPATRWTRQLRVSLDAHGFWLSAEAGPEQRIVGWSAAAKRWFAQDSASLVRPDRERPARYKRGLLRLLLGPRRGRRYSFDRSWEWEREGHVVHDSSTWTGASAPDQ